MEFRFLVGPEVEDAEEHIPEGQRVKWPIDSIVMYCYDDGKIIGRIGAMSIKIIEGTWAASDAPPTTAFRMMKQMEAMLAFLGNTHALALVSTEMPQIANYLQRVGFVQLPVEMYSHEFAAKEKAA